MKMVPQRTIKQRPRVRMRAVDEDVIRRQVKLFLNSLPTEIGHVMVDANQVAADNRDFCFSLPQIENLGLQRVVNAGAGPFVKIATQAITDGCGYVGRCGTDEEVFRRERGVERDDKDCETKTNAGEAALHGMFPGRQVSFRCNFRA